MDLKNPEIKPGNLKEKDKEMEAILKQYTKEVSGLKRSLSDNFDTDAKEMDAKTNEMIVKVHKQFNLS
jgi:hypothetical protein